MTATPNDPNEGKAARRRVVDAVLVIVLALGGLLILASLLPDAWLACLRRSAQRADRAEVPIPADMLVGGVGPLSAGSWLDLYASLPDAQGTPQPYTLTNLRVAALVADSGLLLAVPPAVAPTLQAALLVQDARFAYRLLPGTPTPTSTPTPGNAPTTAPAPTPSAMPGTGQSYLRLGTGDKLDLSASWLATGAAQLVIVEKLELPPLLMQGEVDFEDAALSVHDVTTQTVRVVAFLDKEGTRQAAYDAETTEDILIQLAADQWAGLARSLAGAETVWLIHLEAE
ncbi:MAG TPA: hypothetical protein VLC52_13845 [Anaerolineae bacterium]|nr:hypothetical protein [Anaerolineae bacterium]